ncbi:tyrosine-type recombinase/integrase [uncultured Friedmanniella sp.]|uniref:tyrosine-type recombinase/integrase n=1 Tax=uncultured Friedmanniella sp. TaxID=335381 RepID=UPI0035CA1630
MLRAEALESALTTTQPVRKQRRESWGRLKQERSGRWAAAYLGPDGGLHRAPFGTFGRKLDARSWLEDERRLVAAGAWTAPSRRGRAEPAETFGSYAELWVATRLKKNGEPLERSTIANYQQLLRTRILPEFGEVPLTDPASPTGGITVPMVKRWNVAGRTVTVTLPNGDETTVDTPTAAAKAYGLLAAILATAVKEDLIVKTPCRQSGAANVKRKRKVKVCTQDELKIIVDRLPERYRLMTLLAMWVAMRTGELYELRRSDLDLKRGVVSIQRAVYWVKNEETGVHEPVVGDPKTEDGKRELPIPPHLIPALREHLAGPLCEFGRDGLLFPAQEGGHLRSTTFWKTWNRARIAAGRPDLTFHHLRHTGATMYADAGATAAEMMHLLGHTTEKMAIYYTQASAPGLAGLAARVSERAQA